MGGAWILVVYGLMCLMCSLNSLLRSSYVSLTDTNHANGVPSERHLMRSRSDQEPACTTSMKDQQLNISTLSVHELLLQAPASKLRFAVDNLQGKGAKCGKSKCLFPLSIDPRVGYLVASHKSDRLIHKNMVKGYNLTLQIVNNSDKGGSSMIDGHVYLAPPKLIFEESRTIKWIKKHRRISHPAQHHLPKFPFSRNGEATSVVVQMVEIFDETDALLAGCSRSKFNSTMPRLESFFSRSNRNDAIARNPERVLQQSEDSFAHLYVLLERHNCLLIDFQVLLHRDGRIIHLDMDRCFTPLSTKARRERYERFMPHLKEIQQKIALVLRKRIVQHRKLLLLPT